MIDHSPITETAVLIGLITNRQDESRVNETLDELDFLLETAGGEAENGLFNGSTNPIPALLSARENWKRSNRLSGPKTLVPLFLMTNSALRSCGISRKNSNARSLTVPH
jgi:hypothetical protein